ncbi:MAG: CC0125/CC1285 family lipoprotein [Parvularculaceae bacterium]
MNKLLALSALAGLLLAACATSTPYGPATSKNPFGFSDQKIEDNRYRIVFRGNSSTEREAVETYLLYRAAELTLQNGFDYFVVTEQDTEESRRYSSTGNPAFFGRYYYGYGPYCCAFPYYAYGFGWGSPYNGGFETREITRYSAIAFVTMHKGPKPTDDPQAFDARSVVDNLRSYVVAQPPAS